MNGAKGFLDEFKKFISRGNVLDLAVGVIVGGAFTSIVNSLVKDIIMPLVGWLFGGIDFTELRYVITPASGDTPEAAIYYGNFIQNVVNFLLISFVVFVMVKMLQRLKNTVVKQKEEEKKQEEKKQSEEVALLTEIRDLLKK